jgi:hypothetical protein
MVSSLLGPRVHHYKSCAEGSKCGIADIEADVYAAMMPAPLRTGFCPERWKQAVDVMLKKIPGVHSRTGHAR